VIFRSRPARRDIG